MKIAKNVFTVICDDVREESGNKISLIGIYGGKEIIFDKLPGMVPKIHFVLCLEELKIDVSEIDIKLTLPQMDPFSFHHSPPKSFKLGMNAHLVFAFAPFKINAPGEGKFEIRFGEEKRASVVHKFKILSKELKKK